MRKARAALGLIVAVVSGACAGSPPPPEQAVDWGPSRIAAVPATDLTPPVGADRSRPPLGKFSLRFYQKLRARPVVVPLAAVDVWELRHRPRQYDIITVGPVPLGQYSGRKELLDQLTTTHGLTKDKAAVLTSWVRTGGVVWIEFGVSIQGQEWIRSNDVKKIPPLPDLTGFTVFGLPTRTHVFEARRTGAFTIEPVVYAFRNEAQHPATADVKVLKLVQQDLKSGYPIVDAGQGEALVQEADRVYATVVALGQGKLVSALPFDRWDVESDGEKLRINLAEWLQGYPIPAFDPWLDVERVRD